MRISLAWSVSLAASFAKTDAFSIARQHHLRVSPSLSTQSSRLMASIQEITKDGIYIVDGMPDALPELKNTYYLLRHGQSEGNVEGVISSARSLAYSSKHGLTPLGHEQGLNSAADLLNLIKKSSLSKKKVYFYSSPFSRANQTAEACLEGMKKDENQAIIKNLELDIQQHITIDDGLMERFFGDLDATPLPTYAYVWPEDFKDVTQTGKFNVESVAAVSTRMREVVMRIEESEVHSDSDGGDIIVLTSHADVLQIMQLYASGIDNVGDFSSYRFGNGEVRLMGRTPDVLPERSPLEMPEVMPEV